MLCSLYSMSPNSQRRIQWRGSGDEEAATTPFFFEILYHFYRILSYIADKGHGLLAEFSGSACRLVTCSPRQRQLGKLGSDITKQLRAQTFQFCTALGIECKTVGIFSRFSVVNQRISPVQLALRFQPYLPTGDNLLSTHFKMQITQELV